MTRDPQVGDVFALPNGVLVRLVARRNDVFDAQVRYSAEQDWAPWDRRTYTRDELLRMERLNA